MRRQCPAPRRGLHLCQIYAAQRSEGGRLQPGPLCRAWVSSVGSHTVSRDVAGGALHLPRRGEITSDPGAVARPVRSGSRFPDSGSPASLAKVFIP